MWVYEYLKTGKLARQKARYESPCGFMSAACVQLAPNPALLRIPMWVYEILMHKQTTPICQGYESPCGFMSDHPHHVWPSTTRLRIPMWVYEQTKGDGGDAQHYVTNPHVGL